MTPLNQLDHEALAAVGGQKRSCLLGTSQANNSLVVCNELGHTKFFLSFVREFPCKLSISFGHLKVCDQTTNQHPTLARTISASRRLFIF